MPTSPSRTKQVSEDMAKAETGFSNFEALDIRVGRIISVEESTTKKPTFRIKVDFGAKIGQKVTCGAFKNYTKDQLMGKLVIGLVNVGTKKMGSEVSEFLMLGVPNEKNETIYLMPQQDVPLGVSVF